ncbi:hypothetical protein [uncultured Sunxiuqinia sp.]|uniref:hypothetical protein n=1 Tax=uncultured Sunxiuqinia sp. TaxID=1573825 RepID=UPI002AA8DC67|nr:hypothetical protein [uncultured Sunxiuqinia sp.]
MKTSNHPNKNDQPLLFTSAIYLSLLGGVLGILLFSIAALYFTKTKELVVGVTNLTSMDHVTPLYLLLFVGFCVVSLIGVLKMKRWQKSGFYIYTIAQLAILFLPAIWIDWNAFSVTNGLFSALFILIYLSFIPKMS